VLIVVGSNIWPEQQVLRAGLTALGHPPYAGFLGAFLPHLLLYSTVMAAVSAALWWGLTTAAFLRPPQLSNFRPSIIPGVIAGIAGIVLTLAVVWATMPSGTIHWIPPVPWKIAGNVFSNFFEEFVFRGFVLATLRRVTGFWPAAIISSAIWGALHTQYPLSMKLLIVIVGIGLCWLARRQQSLWAPYIAHEVLDLIGDSLI
jgi:membrane protease YdiL (CAAX protease family)